jgi:hypothetical protein
MERTVGEERKESGENGEGEVNTLYEMEAENRGKSGENDELVVEEEEELIEEDEELQEFPAEIVKAFEEKGFNFESICTEKEFLYKLDAAGYGDIRYVLLESGQPRLIVPSCEHCTVNFQRQRYSWAMCGAPHRIYLDNGRGRDPDVSFWGLHRCSTDTHGGLDLRNSSAIPDVIIQFSWRNTLMYETNAIDDMMNHGLEHDDGPPSTSLPRLGYLIKARFAKKGKRKADGKYNVIGVDVYRLPHGTTIAQARDPNDSAAQYWRWSPGDDEIRITVAPEDVGMPQSLTSRSVGAASHLLGVEYNDDFILRASEIYGLMNR